MTAIFPKRKIVKENIVLRVKTRRIYEELNILTVKTFITERNVKFFNLVKHLKNILIGKFSFVFSFILVASPVQKMGESHYLFINNKIGR